MLLAAGQTLTHHTTLDPLGAGGMGWVHKGLLIGQAGFQRPIVIKQLKKYLVHQLLKCSWCGTQSKRHKKKFKSDISAGKGSFVNVLVSHWDLVITIPEVKFKKY